MNLATWRSGAIILAAGFASACSAIEGYPTDPQNNAVALAGLQQKYFTDQLEVEYEAAVGSPDRRQAIRNRIVFGRMQVHEIYFSQFQRSLNADANTLNVGAGIIGVALGGLGAVIADATTKSAISAASGGVIGAQGVVNKDLYYQKTVAALIAQMEANRENAKAAILDNLKQPDANYPLWRAYVDLEALANAGSLPAAISAITQKANTDKQDAQTRVQLTKLTYVDTEAARTLDAWITPDGVISLKRVKALNAWLEKNYRNSNIPVAGLVRDDGPKGEYEAIRKKALADTELMKTPAK